MFGGVGGGWAVSAACEWGDKYLWQGTYTAALGKRLRGGREIKNVQYCYSFASFTVWHSWQMNKPHTALEQLLLLDFSSLANQQGPGVYETLLFCMAKCPVTLWVQHPGGLSVSKTKLILHEHWGCNNIQYFTELFGLIHNRNRRYFLHITASHKSVSKRACCASRSTQKQRLMLRDFLTTRGFRSYQ